MASREPQDTGTDADLLLAGGGLAGGLIALAVKRRHPDARIRIIEPGERLGGNHVWSWFDSDIAAADRWLVDGLADYHWGDYDIAFPARRRTLPTGYNSMLSETLDRAVRGAIGNDAIITDRAIDVGGRSVLLSNQQRRTAHAVIDARGQSDWDALDCGWQKFVGRIYHLAAPHGLARPVIMDATVDQIDGFRFVYLLPFAPDAVFVEDTYYSNDSALDAATLSDRLDAYVAARGWTVERVSRQEVGVLPVVMGGDIDTFRRRGQDAPDSVLAGARAALFQPVTSYSLPDAVRLATRIAAAWPCDAPALAALVREHADARWRAGRFGRLLNRMLFRAAQPAERYRVLEHFYRLPPATIDRFYSGDISLVDRFRILSGRPPVPISAAIATLME